MKTFFAITYNKISSANLVCLLPFLLIIPGCHTEKKLTPQDPNVVFTVRSAVIASSHLNDYEKILIQQEAPVVRVQRIDWFITFFWDWKFNNGTKIHVEGYGGGATIDANDLFIKITHDGGLQPPKLDR